MEIKLVGFDWDGTLCDISERSSWQVIDRELGVEEEDAKLNDLYFDGKLEYSEWSRQSVELYRKRGLTLSKFLQILEKMSLTVGALETFEELRKRGIKIAIISGSIGNIYDYFSQKQGLRADYVSFASRIHFDAQGNISGGEFNNYDWEGKADALKKFCDEMGISLSDCAFVGDSDNDISIFKVAYGIAFMPEKGELEKFAKQIVREKNLTQILKFL